MKKLVYMAILLILAVIPAAGQERGGVWERWDARVYDVDTTANSFRVAETQEMTFTGTFRFGVRAIPLNRIDSIGDIQVYEGERALATGCDEQPGTFCARRDGNEWVIEHYFFEPVTDESVTFTIEYTAQGALRVYASADQLWWAAIPADRPYPVKSSTVTVEMPDGYAPRYGEDSVTTPAVNGEIWVSGTMVRAVATREIAVGEVFEVRFDYPHNPQARKSSWQFNEERPISQPTSSRDGSADAENTFWIIVFVFIGIPLIIYGWIRRLNGEDTGEWSDDGDGSGYRPRRSWGSRSGFRSSSFRSSSSSRSSSSRRSGGSSGGGRSRFG